VRKPGENGPGREYKCPRLLNTHPDRCMTGTPTTGEELELFFFSFLICHLRSKVVTVVTFWEHGFVELQSNHSRLDSKLERRGATPETLIGGAFWPKNLQASSNCVADIPHAISTEYLPCENRLQCYQTSEKFNNYWRAHQMMPLNVLA
jgi:hypothetical protein